MSSSHLKPSEAEWLRVKADVRRMYIVDEMSLKNLVVEVRNLGLAITKAQLEYKLKQWGFRKNIDKSTWISIDNQITKRKEDGKDSHVIHRGKRLKQSTIQKETGRHRDMTIFARLAPAPSLPSSDLNEAQVEICTPQSLPLEFNWPNSLPWLEFQATHFQLMFNAHHQEHSLGISGCILQGSEHYMSLAYGIMAPGSRLGLNNQISSLSGLAGLIRTTMPECYPEEHLRSAHSLLHGPAEESLLECLRLVLYRVSNNLSSLLDRQVWEATMAIFQDYRILDLQLDFRKHDDLIIHSFTENLFRAALFWIACADEDVIEDREPYLVLNWLFSSGQPPNISLVMETDSDTEALTPLQYSVEQKSLTLIRCLLDWGADVHLVQPHGRWTMSPLEIALSDSFYDSDDQQIVTLLLRHGASSNLDLALNFAIRARNRELVKELLQRGVDLHYTLERQEWDSLKFEHTALSSAAAVGLSDTRFILDLLARHCPSTPVAEFINANVFIAAAINGQDDAILHLWNIKGALSPNSHGMTPLQAAAYSGSLSTCQLLVLLGCPHISSTMEISPVHLASIRGHEDVVRFFIENGVDVNAVARIDESVRTLFNIYTRHEDFVTGDFTALHLLLSLFDGHGLPRESLSCAVVLIQAGARLVGSEVQVAAWSLNPELLSAALAVGADPNRKSPGEFSALKAALRQADGRQTDGALVRTVSLLLQQGAIFVGGEMTTAVLSGDWGLVSLLLSYGGSLMDVDNCGMTAIEAAILAKEPLIFDNLVQANLMAYDAGCLCAAITAGRDSTVESLLANRPTQAPSSILEMTAVGLAAKRGSIHLLRKILACVPWSETALLPIESLKFELRYAYVQHFWRTKICVRGSPLALCAIGGITETFSELLKCGFQPDNLTWAIVIEKNNLAMAQMMVADNEQLAIGLSMPWFHKLQDPLIHPVRRNNKEFTLLLLKAGLDVNYHNRAVAGSRSPLQTAVETGDSSLVECLLGAGADINAPPALKAGGTALQLASALGLLEIAKLLLDRGADVNALPAQELGRTALEGAAEQGKLEVVGLLLSHGVLTTGNGQLQYVRAVKLAIKEGHSAAARLLREFREWSEEDEMLFEKGDLVHPNDYWSWDSHDNCWALDLVIES